MWDIARIALIALIVLITLITLIVLITLVFDTQAKTHLMIFIILLALVALITLIALTNPIPLKYPMSRRRRTPWRPRLTTVRFRPSARRCCRYRWNQAWAISAQYGIIMGLIGLFGFIRVN